MINVKIGLLAADTNTLNVVTINASVIYVRRNPYPLVSVVKLHTVMTETTYGIEPNKLIRKLFRPFTPPTTSGS